MAMVQYEIDPKRKLSEEEEKMLETASQKPVQYDEDLPKLIKEQLAQFHRRSDMKREV